MPGSSRHGLTIIAHDAVSSTPSELGRELEESELAALGDACLQDLISDLIQLSEVSFTVAAPDPVAAERLRHTLPAGVNVIAGDPTWGPAERDRFVFAEARARGAERSVILAGDTLALPVSTVGTAFGVLASADIVIGATRTGERYLAGAESEAGIEAILDAGSEPDGLLRLATERGLVARRMEPRPRLAGMRHPGDLQSIASLGPRVTAWLGGRFGIG